MQLFYLLRFGEPRPPRFPRLVPLWTPPKGVNGDDKRVHIAGNLTLPAAPVGEVHWHGASPAAVTVRSTARTLF